MTLPTSGAISLTQIAGEFGLAANSVFPTAFYGKGGAPASGALSFADFYGRSGSMIVTASPSSVSGVGSGAIVDSNPSTCSVAGGTAPYSYSWSQVSGDFIVAINPTAAITAFRGGGMGVGELRTAVFKCTATDAGAMIVASNNVSVTIERT